ncbi:MAG: [Fe-S]-binding protein [Anaerolineales bacterium]|nr:MAG: [Fe-S]-binding protein [Anaerolineales bacterium]
MLTTPEKIIFILAVLFSLSLTSLAVRRIVRIIQRGHGRPDFSVLRKRLLSVPPRIIAFQPVFRFRLVPSLFHAMIGWGFLYFLLVNLADVLQAYLPNYTFLGTGLIGNLFRLGADISSLLVFVGISFMLVRRFVIRSKDLTARSDVLLHPKARTGILRDSAIVGAFVTMHVLARFVGESFKLAEHGTDSWQPFASTVSRLWSGWEVSSLVIGFHACFWISLGWILAFLPYFLYSKHIHLFFAPLNFLLKPARRSIGELSRLDFDDESVEAFGVSKLEDLGWEQLMDAYACIMCYRCQQVCPAYNTGKVLSPAALEINKRYFLNYYGAEISGGKASPQTLIEFAIPEEAIWACTACGACVDICPVNNEPMRDILDIRRALVLNENAFPQQLQTAFRGMERNVNPWNIPPTERLKWAEGLNVPTIEENPTPEILWWVGCAPATDVRAQKVAQAFAHILEHAGMNYAVLGKNEQCTGDSARRAGNEYLFNELASSNVQILNEVNPRRIVTTCPHCLHTLKNEYPAFGGNYTVIHHTQLIQELISEGKIRLASLSPDEDPNNGITYHDPCYLGRHNHIIDEPRTDISLLGGEFTELHRHAYKSFCCGAGGAQMWKEEEHGQQRVNANRFAEAQATGADALAVACPFCLIMLTDAQKAANSELRVLDIAELLAARLE